MRTAVRLRTAGRIELEKEINHARGCRTLCRKHPDGTKLDPKAAEAVKARVSGQKISCRAAHEAAAEAGVSPSVIGRTLDLLEIRINGCQLGLFGHKGGGEHGKAELRLPENAAGIESAVTSKAGPDV